MHHVLNSRSRLTIGLIFGALLLALFAVFVSSNEQPALGVTTATAAQVDYFLKIDGVEGEATSQGHEGEIEILSYSWGELEPGISTPTNSSGLPTGKRQHKPLVVTKSVDKASPKLMEAVANGQQFPEATLFVRSPGGTEYLEYKLTNILISSYQVSGSGSEAPADTLSLNFEEIKQTYTPVNNDGSLGEPVSGTYNVSGKQSSEPR